MTKDVPKSIAFTQLSELQANYASERGANKTTGDWSFANASREQVHVVHRGIQPF